MDVYSKLAGFSEQDLHAVASFIDFMIHQKGIKGKKPLRLEGILLEHDIDCTGLKSFREQSWRHLEGKFGNE